MSSAYQVRSLLSQSLDPNTWTKVNLDYVDTDTFNEWDTVAHKLNIERRSQSQFQFSVQAMFDLNSTEFPGTPEICTLQIRSRSYPSGDSYESVVEDLYPSVVDHGEHNFNGIVTLLSPSDYLELWALYTPSDYWGVEPPTTDLIFANMSIVEI